MTLLLLVIAAASAGPCTEALPVRLDDIVACEEAILMPPDMARALAKCRDVSLPTCSEQLAFSETSMRLTTDLLTAQLVAERQLSADLRMLLDNPPVAPLKWFEHPAFWGAVGIAVGAIAPGIGLAAR